MAETVILERPVDAAAPLPLVERLTTGRFWESLVGRDGLSSLYAGGGAPETRGAWPGWSHVCRTPEELPPGRRYDLMCLEAGPSWPVHAAPSEWWRWLAGFAQPGGALLVVEHRPGARRIASLCANLEEAGWRVERLYASVPSADGIRGSLAVDDWGSEPYWRLIVPTTAAGRARRWAVRRLGPFRAGTDVTVWATRPGSPAQPAQPAVWLQRTAGALAADGPLRWAGAVCSSGQSLISIVTDRAGCSAAVLKVPLTSRSLDEHRRAVSVRRRIRQDDRIPGPLRALVPETLWAAEPGERYAEADRFMDGVPARLWMGRSPRRRASLAARACDYAAALHEATRVEAPGLTETIRAGWEALGRQEPVGPLPACAVVDRPCPRVLAHNDFHPGNLLVDPATGGLSAVLDWQFADPEGWPGVDLIRYYAALGAAERPLAWRGGLRRLLAALARPASAERRAFERYCTRLRLPGNPLLPAWLLLYYVDQRLRDRVYHPGTVFPRADADGLLRGIIEVGRAGS